MTQSLKQGSLTYLTKVIFRYNMKTVLYLPDGYYSFFCLIIEVSQTLLGKDKSEILNKYMYTDICKLFAC